jgi:hypothetical protein
MAKFWELLERSVIFQGVLVISVVGAYLYLIVTGRPIPNELHLMAGTIVGFFFGGKVQVEATRAAGSAAVAAVRAAKEDSP